MAAIICFLRGVNVGGKGKVPMAELKALLEDELGFENVKTVLQSGNVVFTAKGALPALTKKIEAAIEKAFKYQSDVHLLTPAALRKIIEDNPFKAEEKKDPSHMVGVIVPKAPAKDAQEKLEAIAKPGEKIKVTPHAVYLFHRDGMADTKIAGGTLDRALGCRGTGRNWNTLNKVLELAEGL
ncbi:MAG TPA: DUF1697 domain-containing protein [Rhizomicrobium sp.]|nr:DUF1697 domain-containing protein [Rhizomicrobium sp.]